MFGDILGAEKCDCSVERDKPVPLGELHLESIEHSFGKARWD
jgi:hypothetical protein